MLELQIIKHLLVKENYNKYRESIKPSKENEKYYKILDDLHNSLARDLTVDEYSLLVDNENIKEIVKQGNLAEDYLNKVCTDIRLRQTLYDLAVLSVDIAEGRKELNILLNAVESIDSSTQDELQFLDWDIERNLKIRSVENGIPFRLNSLQSITTGLHPGDFALIFARVNCGKTTFLVSEVSYMAEHVDRPILWFNNEEAGTKVQNRIVQASLNYDIMQLSYNAVEAQNRFLNRTKGNIKFIDDARVDYRKAEHLIKRINPALIVFDQLDKVKGFKSDKLHVELGKKHIWARELAKVYNSSVIAMGQASSTGLNKKWLGEEDMSESKTDKSAEADLLIGIGRNDDAGYEKFRYLNIIKNKLTGNDPFKITCKIDQDRARYLDIM